MKRIAIKTYRHSSARMHEIRDEAVHLIVTSPPYPMIAKWDELFKKVNRNKIDFDLQHVFLDSVWRECHRVLISGGICCINIGDATRTINKNFCCYPNYARVMYECHRIGFTPLIPVIWKKISNRPNAFLGSGFLPPNAYVSQDCEYIMILRKGVLRKFPPKDKNRIKSKFTKAQRDLWFQQVWEIHGAKGAKQTSAFPEEIPSRLIRMFSVIGDTVVDPFCGTGTVGKVANHLNRNFIGYNI